jgi:K+-transporting ATPase ATPase C chain
MRRFIPELGVALRLVAATMVVTGLIYPLFMTGAAQLMFPGRANGNLVEQNGRVVGSSLIGQQFTSPGYFHGRPSATTDVNGSPDPYNADNSSASNLGPTNPQLILNVEQNADAIRCAEGLPPGPPPLVTPTPSAAPAAAGSPAAGSSSCAAVSQSQTQIPVDAVTSSGSGLDPDISVAYAMLQVPRVAQARNLPQAEVRTLVQDETLGRQFRVLGEERVNVLDLNLALDRLAFNTSGGARP